MNNTARIIAKAFIKTNDGNYDDAIEQVRRAGADFTIPTANDVINQIKEIMVEEIILDGRESGHRETDNPIPAFQRIK